MVYTTIKHAIKSTLANLRKRDFTAFCQHLGNRRGEPRVRPRDVKDKDVLEITDLLVSTFTEPGARQVTLEILRKMNLNDEAQTLYSKTKDFVDKGDPTSCKTSTGGLETKPSLEALNHTASQWPAGHRARPAFRKTSTGGLETKPSQEALNHTASQWPAGHRARPVTAKKPEEVEAEAKARILAEGGDPRNERLVLSSFMIQFGKYKGQTFKWLLENDVDYTAYLVAGHQQEQQDTMSQDPLTANKDSLTRYAIAYPEILKEVRVHRAYNQSRQSGQKGEALVGFGIYRSETLKDLYMSKDKDKISYVNFLRTKKSTCDPRTKMYTAVKYILQCDQKQAAAAKRKRVQSTRGQPACTSRPIWRNLRRRT